MFTTIGPCYRCSIFVFIIKMHDDDSLEVHVSPTQDRSNTYKTDYYQAQEPARAWTTCRRVMALSNNPCRVVERFPFWNIQQKHLKAPITGVMVPFSCKRNYFLFHLWIYPRIHRFWKDLPSLMVFSPRFFGSLANELHLCVRTTNDMYYSIAGTCS